MSQAKILLRVLFSRGSQFGHLVYIVKRGVAINKPLKAFTASFRKISRMLIKKNSFSLELYLSISQNKGKNTNEKTQPPRVNIFGSSSTFLILRSLGDH